MENISYTIKSPNKPFSFWINNKRKEESKQDTNLEFWMILDSIALKDHVSFGSRGNPVAGQQGSFLLL